MNDFVRSRRDCLILGLTGLLAACAGRAPVRPAGASATFVAPPPHPALAQVPATTLLNRLCWGADPASAQALEKAGVAAYLDAQLQPRPTPLPALVQAQIDAMTISQLPLERLMAGLETQRHAAKEQKGRDDSLNKAYHQELARIGREAASRTVLRALYSPNQLQEQMIWFWMNHFNIHQGKHDVRAMLGDFEEQAIRPHALGNFRNLVRATALHPAMLRYLDNEHNAAGRINENYARELLELHTMGVDGGYSQQDVQELARILTGFGVRHDGHSPRLPAEQQKLLVRRGWFEFNPARHDFGEKHLLGQTIYGRGASELDVVLELLCRQPATAHFVSRKLAWYFVSDTPSPALIDTMAAAFLRSDGDIAATLRCMLATQEFAASLGGKFKDPLHYVLSALRLAYADATIANPAPVLHWLGQLGQPFNGHQTPDGYALTATAWSSPAQMNQRFEVTQAIGAGSPALFRGAGADSAVAAPLLARSPYVQDWASRFGQSTRTALSQAAGTQEWNVLFLSSPEMMRR